MSYTPGPWKPELNYVGHIDVVASGNAVCRIKGWQVFGREQVKTYHSAPSPRTEEKLQHLRDLLPAGRETPMLTFLLCGILECKARQLQEWVAELRERGVLVGSTDRAPFGYFLIQTPSDFEEGTRHFRHRAASTFAIARSMDKAAKERFGPETPTLFDFAEAV